MGAGGLDFGGAAFAGACACALTALGRAAAPASDNMITLASLRDRRASNEKVEGLKTLPSDADTRASADDVICDANPDPSVHLEKLVQLYGAGHRQCILACEIAVDSRPSLYWDRHCTE